MKKPLTPKLREIILYAFKAGVSMVFIAHDQEVELMDVEQVIREALMKKDKRK